MLNKSGLVVLCSLLAWAQLSHGAAEGNLGRDGNAQKLFREQHKKMEGLMSSPWGREKVLGTYAFYDMKDERWKMEFLEEILEYYDLGTIAKE